MPRSLCLSLVVIIDLQSVSAEFTDISNGHREVQANATVGLGGMHAYPTGGGRAVAQADSSSICVLIT